MIVQKKKLQKGSRLSVLAGEAKVSKSNGLCEFGVFQRPSNAFLRKAEGPLQVVVARPASHQV